MTNSPFEIVPVRDDYQIRLTAELAGEIWQEHFTPIIGADQVAYMLKNLQSFEPMKRQIQEGYEYFLLQEGDRPVGYTAIRESDGRLFLSKIYLLRSARGKHYASNVMRHHLALCRARGLSAVWLTCNRFNSDTIRVYEHFGFRKIREEKADIGCGYYMDDYIMELNLSPENER